MQCAEGLEWLKGLRASETSADTGSGIPAPAFVDRSRTTSLNALMGSSPTNFESVHKDIGVLRERDREVRLNVALQSLDRAKNEANSTLAPIMDRMRKAHRIKSAESVIKRLAPILDFPHRMKMAESSGRLDETLRIFRLVLSLNDDEGLSSSLATSMSGRNEAGAHQQNDNNSSQKDPNIGTTSLKHSIQGGGATAGGSSKSSKHA